MTGAATQICSARFDAKFFSFPESLQSRIQFKIDEMGRRLRNFPHYHMEGADTFRLRIGDYRVIYQLNLDRNEIYLIAVGHRREIYR